MLYNNSFSTSRYSNWKRAKCEVVKVVGSENSLYSSSATLVSYGILGKLFSLSIVWFSHSLGGTLLALNPLDFYEN